MNLLTKIYKRTFYRLLYVKKDVLDALAIRDPNRVSSTLGPHIKDIFWSKYKKMSDMKKQP